MKRSLGVFACAAGVALGAVGAPNAEEHFAAELKPIEILASSEKAPTAGTKATLYPEEARKSGTEGFATLRCEIQAEGGFTGCRALDEEPSNAGFAEAAIRAAGYLKQPLVDAHGKPILGSAIVPFEFALEERRRELLKFPPNSWEMKPRGIDMARVYPEHAQRADVDGAATIYCRIAPNGYLSACRAVLETPYGWGFKQAALALAPLFKLKDVMADGRPRPVSGLVRIPILFRLPKG